MSASDIHSDDEIWEGFVRKARKGYTTSSEACEILSKYEYGPDLGGVIRYKGLTGDEAQKLITIDAVEPTDQQNDAPSFATLAKLAGDTGTILGGYRVLSFRPDERITCDAIYGTVSNEVLKTYIQPMCGNADEFRVVPRRGTNLVFFEAWWD